MKKPWEGVPYPGSDPGDPGPEPLPVASEVWMTWKWLVNRRADWERADRLWRIARATESISKSIDVRFAATRTVDARDELLLLLGCAELERSARA